MPYVAKILLDSLAPSGARLITFELCYPRFIHAQLLTHRAFSRNAASSRAIPIAKMIERVRSEPARPLVWGRNQKGMQAGNELEGNHLLEAKDLWEEAVRRALDTAENMMHIGVHKQIVNRLLEPFMWITTIVSATDYQNFFDLRCDDAAQPEFQHLARMMRDAYAESEPKELRAVNGLAGWHMPFITDEDRKELSDRPLGVAGLFETACKISVGRCARVSYLTHDGQRDIQADIDLHDRLAKSGHWSPFEHVAQALATPERSGNFVGWKQYRKEFQGEHFGGPMP